MRTLGRCALLLAVVGSLAVGATPAAASPTCVTGASCTLNLRGSDTLSLPNGITFTCDWNLAASVRDGNDSISTSSLSFSGCASNIALYCPAPTLTTANQVWTMTLTNSGSPARLSLTVGGATTLECGGFGRLIIPRGASCVDGAGGSTATITPGATVRVALSCRLPYNATGLFGALVGSSGTGTLAVTLSGTDAARTGISIS